MHFSHGSAGSVHGFEDLSFRREQLDRRSSQPFAVIEREPGMVMRDTHTE